MDTETAFEIEGALIDAFELDQLKNIQNGQQNVRRGPERGGGGRTLYPGN